MGEVGNFGAKRRTKGTLLAEAVRGAACSYWLFNLPDSTLIYCKGWRKSLRNFNTNGTIYFLCQS